MLFAYLECRSEILLLSVSSLSFCVLPSLNNTNENTKTHILTSAVCWSRGALYWLHGGAAQSPLEVLERKLKLLMQPSSIPLPSQTQNKDRAKGGDDCFRYGKNSSVRVVSLLFDLTKYSLPQQACCQHFFWTNGQKNDIEQRLNTPMSVRYTDAQSSNIRPEFFAKPCRAMLLLVAGTRTLWLQLLKACPRSPPWTVLYMFVR